MKDFSSIMRPSDEEVEWILKQSAIRKYGEYCNAGKFNDFGFPTFDYLKKRGFLNYSAIDMKHIEDEAKKGINASAGHNTVNAFQKTQLAMNMNFSVESKMKYLQVCYFFEYVRSAGKQLSELL